MLLASVSSTAADDENVVTLSADTTRWYPDDKVTASGNVRASYRDYEVTADSAEADLRANIAVFHGDVQLVTNGYTVYGESLSLNLKTRDWNLEGASSRIDPQALQGNTQGPAFIRGASLSGENEDLKLVGGTLTTCDLGDPHYYFSAKELEIHPDSKIIARKVSMVGLGRRFFTLNSLVIPISGFRHNLIPQVGSSAEEGTFIKTAYAYTATERSQGFLKLDLMQKRGVGTGIEHFYEMTAGSGQASLYYLADQEIGGSNVTGRLQHQQRLGSVNLDLSADYRTRSYLYYPSSTSQNWQVGASRSTPMASTSLVFQRNTNRGFGTYETLNSSLRHAQQFNGKLSGMFSVDMRTYKSSGIPAADRELESVVELRQREDKYDLSLVASKRLDLDDDDFTGDDFYSSLDRLPELTFNTDSYRFGRNLFFGLPSRLSVGAGRYHEEPSGVTSDRLLLEWDMLGSTVDLDSKNDLHLTAGFRQAYYAGDMAQHVLKFGGVLTSRFNDYMKTRLRYNYQRPEGYSPFRFDYTGRHNYARAVMDYQDSGKLRWSLSTGYDLNRDRYPWQDLALRLAAYPSPSYAFSLSTGYDLNRSEWRNLISQFRVSVPERVGLEIGTRYDVRDGKLGLARGRLDVHIGKKWRLEGITSWNGTMERFDYRSFRLTRDLHCWEVSLSYNDETGFRRDKGITLEMRIKAFPSVDRFGIGQYGQAVDTSMGEYYY